VKTPGAFHDLGGEAFFENAFRGELAHEVEEGVGVEFFFAGTEEVANGVRAGSEGVDEMRAGGSAGVSDSVRGVEGHKFLLVKTGSGPGFNCRVYGGDAEWPGDFGKVIENGGDLS
jgi:hypothetical protein